MITKQVDCCEVFSFAMLILLSSLHWPLCWGRDAYYFLPFFLLACLRIVPNSLSPLVSLPSGFLTVPGGTPCFFSKLLTVMSLLSFRGFLLVAIS